MTPDNQRLVAVVCYCPYPFLSVASVKLVVILRILDFLDIIQKTVDVQTHRYLQSFLSKPQFLLEYKSKQV